MTERIMKLTYMTIISLQLIFLLIIGIERINNKTIVLPLSLLLILLVVGTKISAEKLNKPSLDSFTIIIYVLIGAIATYQLNLELRIGAILAASTIGLLGSLITKFSVRKELNNSIPTAVYCGAFIGMTSIAIAPNLGFVLLASLITGLMLMYSKNLLVGIGGKFGTFAFAGVVFAYFISIAF